MTLDHLLICGLGSIGRRHLRHFRSLGVGRIDAYRTGKATLQDDGQMVPDRIFSSLEEALVQMPQAAVIANPSALHLSTARAAINAGAHVLIEKPISNSMEGCSELLSGAASRGLVVAVGCNMRFHPLLLLARDVITDNRLGRAVSARAHFWSYLPDWHPWEDYHGSYAARLDMGGGATLTHIHEIDYLLWFFGPALEAAGICSDVHPLGTDVDEASIGMMRHRSGVLSSVSLSLCQKPQSRQLHISFEQGQLSLDLINHTLVMEDSRGNSRREVLDNFLIDETYSAQAKAFVDALDGNKDDRLCTGAEGIAALRVAATFLRGGEK